MKKNLSPGTFCLVTALILLAGCTSIPQKTGPDDSLVVIKTEIINPDGLPLGRNYFIHYSDNRAPSQLGANGGKFVTAVIASSAVTTTSISTSVGAGFIGQKAAYEFVNPLPYQPGEIVIADFVLSFKMERSPQSPSGYQSYLSVRKITDEEKEGLLNAFRADSAFAEWLSPSQ